MYILLKFRFSKKATKFETISHMIWSLLVGDCFKFLWPSQNVRTLKESGFRRIWKSDNIGTINHKKFKFSLFSEIFCNTAMVK